MAAPRLLLSLGTAAAFRLRVVGAVVEEGSAVSIAEEAFECEVVAAGTPDGREAWATWRAVDRVILGDMSVNARVQTAGRVCAWEGGLKSGRSSSLGLEAWFAKQGKRRRQPSRGRGADENVPVADGVRGLRGSGGLARPQDRRSARPSGSGSQVTSNRPHWRERVGGGRDEKKKWPRRACGRKKWNGARRGNEHR